MHGKTCNAINNIFVISLWIVVTIGKACRAASARLTGKPSWPPDNSVTLCWTYILAWLNKLNSFFLSTTPRKITLFATPNSEALKLAALINSPSPKIFKITSGWFLKTSSKACNKAIGFFIFQFAKSKYFYAMYLLFSHIPKNKILDYSW